MALIDLDNEFLDLFYNITNSKVPAEPTLLVLKKIVLHLQRFLSEQKFRILSFFSPL